MSAHGPSEERIVNTRSVLGFGVGLTRRTSLEGSDEISKSRVRLLVPCTDLAAKPDPALRLRLLVNALFSHPSKRPRR